MNWLGAGVGSFLASALGAIVGALLHFFLRRYLGGIDAPVLVGLISGASAAFASRERIGLRGALVGSLSVWAAAIAEVAAAPTGRGLFHDLIAFHDRLGILRMALYFVCAMCGVILGSRAFRVGLAPETDSGGRHAQSEPRTR
jgi:hypothetical protein